MSPTDHRQVRVWPVLVLALSYALAVHAAPPDAGTHGRGDAQGFGGLGLRGGRDGGAPVGYGEPGLLGPRPAPRFRVDLKVEVTGALTQEQAHRLVLQNRAQVKYCFESKLPPDAGTPPPRVLTFHTRADGTAFDPKVEGPADAVAECLAGRSVHWQFPAAKAPTAVQVKIDVRPAP